MPPSGCWGFFQSIKNMVSRYVDIPRDLKKGARLLRDEEVVVQRVRTLLTTEPGDFMDTPAYGTPLMQYLYEGLTEDTESLIKMTINHSIRTWLDGQVRIDNIVVKVVNDAHYVSIELGLFLIEFDKSVSIVESFNN